MLFQSRQPSTWFEPGSHPCKGMCGEVSFWVLFLGLFLCTTGCPHTVGGHPGVPILGPGFGSRNGAANGYRQPVESTLSQAWLMSAFWVPDA